MSERLMRPAHAASSFNTCSVGSLPSSSQIHSASDKPGRAADAAGSLSAARGTGGSGRLVSRSFRSAWGQWSLTVPFSPSARRISCLAARDAAVRQPVGGDEAVTSPHQRKGKSVMFPLTAGQIERDVFSALQAGQRPVGRADPFGAADIMQCET